MRSTLATVRMAVLAAGVLATGLCTTPALAAPDGVVPTDSGPVVGTVTDTHRTFQSIPFAAPPVGELRWVQRNVRAFGGDPDNVTLFGHSAGAISACGHLTSPLARGLFHKVIIQSGPCSIPGFLASLQAVEATGASAAANLGCADLECLRRLPVDTLLTVQNTFRLPAYNTRVWPREPAQALRDGQHYRIPS